MTRAFKKVPRACQKVHFDLAQILDMPKMHDISKPLVIKKKSAGENFHQQQLCRPIPHFSQAENPIKKFYFRALS
jgi:hypothetical protein